MPNQQKPNENGQLFAILAYILPVVGGIIGLAVNKDNALTRTHAYQSIGAVLSLILTFVTWVIVAYAIAIMPSIRSLVVLLTYALVVIGGLYVLSQLRSADLAEKVKTSSTRKLAWAGGLYLVGGGLYYMSQLAPDILPFVTSIVEILLPVSELYMPIVLLATLIWLGANILPSPIMRLLSVAIIANLLTWLPLVVFVVSIALFGLVIAMMIFLAINWVYNLVTAIQGKERVIPISNRLVTQIFGDDRKSKSAEASA